MAVDNTRRDGAYLHSGQPDEPAEQDRFDYLSVDKPYRYDHNPLNEDFHGGICSACEWERDRRPPPIVVRIGSITIEHGERTDSIACLCGRPEYFFCPDWLSQHSTLNRECCCSVEDGGTYCGQPECDVYYCHDCGDEFSEPCPRHEGVNTP